MSGDSCRHVRERMVAAVDVLKAKQYRNIPRKQIHHYHVLADVTMLLLTLPIFRWRRRSPLSRSHWRVTKIFTINWSFVEFYHKFGFYIETLTNNAALLSFKHVKRYANDDKLPCKHSNRSFPSRSWILVTHSDLGNEFPFWYRADIIWKPCAGMISF